jgi:hypothetical protein
LVSRRRQILFVVCQGDNRGGFYQAMRGTILPEIESRSE